MLSLLVDLSSGCLLQDRIRREAGEYFTITPSGVVHVVQPSQIAKSRSTVRRQGPS